MLSAFGLASNHAEYLMQFNCAQRVDIFERPSETLSQIDFVVYPLMLWAERIVVRAVLLIEENGPF